MMRFILKGLLRSGFIVREKSLEVGGFGGLDLRRVSFLIFEF